MVKLYQMPSKVLFILLFLLFSIVSIGQRTNFRFHQFNNENKLNEELIKSVQQDSLGIYYFASDQGLLSLMNDNFTSYNLPENKSTYFKEIFKRRNGEIIAVSDDAIFKVKSSFVSAEIESLIECNKDINKPKYPKHLYEDVKGNLWIADYRNVYKYDGDTVIKYEMDEKNLTSSYARSYQFLECDNGKLIAVSQKGWFYGFDSSNNSFEECSYKLESIIQSSYKMGPNEFLLGTSQGIIKLIFDFKGHVVHQEVVDQGVLASCFERLSDNKLLVGTWFQGLVEIELNNPHKVYPVGGFPYFTVNDIFLDSYGKYWVSTNSGAVVLERKFFSSQFQSANSEYISSIVLNENGDINFSGRSNIFEIDDHAQIQSLAYDFEGSLNVFKSKGSTTLLGTEQGKLFIYNNKEQIMDVKISDHPITSIELTSSLEAWVVANKELYKVDLITGKFKSYIDSFRGMRIVQDICLDENNNLYVGGEYTHSYLFRYNESKNLFENISVFIPFEINQDLWIRDLELDNDTLYLGSSSGLLKFVDGNIERLDLGEMTNSEVNSVAKDRNNGLWLTTSKGVIRKTKTDISLFTPDQGLPSKTFTTRSLLIDQNDYLWVGTSNGIAFAHIPNSVPVTPKPIVHMPREESEFIFPEEKVSLTANSMLLFDVTATIYPQKQNKFQYCVIRGSETKCDWKELTSKNQILIAGLKPGNYTIRIQCKHEGNYTWSEHQVISLRVSQVWYLRWYAFVSEILIILFFIFLTNEYSKKRTKQNLIALEKIVSDRTVQLQKVNESLKTANVAKDKFLSIIAHDLRNPFNAIRGFARILLKDAAFLSEEDKSELIETIYRSSDDTFKLLESMLEWANVQKGNIKLNKQEFELSDIMIKNLDLHKSLGALKQLVVKGDFEKVKVKADKAMIDTVIRNLLSNAIKYSYPKQKIELNSTLKNGLVIIQVKDEGMGMKKENLDKLFKVDTVFTSEGTANESGTGFGLMLSKEFVELNGGKIWVESEQGNGTSFFFSIPLK